MKKHLVNSGLWVVGNKFLIVLLLTTFYLLPTAQAQFKLTETATIDSAGTTSTIIDLNGYTLTGIVFPATFTGATVTITTSADTTTANFKTLQYDGSDVSITATDGKYCQVKPVEVWGLLRYIKIVSASAEGDDRTIIIYKTRL